jgi:hypothetical protein
LGGRNRLLEPRARGESIEGHLPIRRGRHRGRVAVTPSVSAHAASAQRKRIAKIRLLYDRLLGTAPHDIIAGTLPETDVFAENVRGRVTPLGHYDSLEAAREYFYGLIVAPKVSTAAVELRSIVASGDQVAVEADVSIDLSVTPLARIVKLRETGFFRFDKRNRITAFDLALLNLGAALDPRSDAERDLRMQGVCLLAATNCPGEFDGSTAGAKAADCVAFMQTKPYRSWNRGNSDTFTCRELHSVLTSLRRDVHCPHVGKTGGMVCVDVPYESYFDARC